MEVIPQMLILCGGLGTRLKPVVNDRPKPMALVDGRPFLEHVIDYFRRQGVADFILCAGHMGEQIELYFRGFSNIEVVVEPIPLGTGGSILNAARLISANYFFAVNGDSFCRVDLLKLLNTALMGDALAALTAVEVDNAAECGALEFDETGRLTHFNEKSPTARSAAGKAWVNAGVYCFSKQVCSGFQRETNSLELHLIPALVRTSRVNIMAIESELLDIGTPERLSTSKDSLGRILNQKSVNHHD